MTTYSFQDVTATLVGPGGAFSLGYGEAGAAESIEISRAAPRNTMKIGADGNGMHCLSADKSGKVTLKYLRTSPINAKLMALYDAQQLDSRLWGKNLIEVGQSAAGDLHTARGCAFSKVPNLKYAEGTEYVEWEFDAIKIDGVLGIY